MLTRAATVVQQLCKSCRTCFMFYCMFYVTCDRSFMQRRPPVWSTGRRGAQAGSSGFDSSALAANVVGEIVKVHFALARRPAVGLCMTQSAQCSAAVDSRFFVFRSHVSSATFFRPLPSSFTFSTVFHPRSASSIFFHPHAHHVRNIQNKVHKN